MSEQDTNKILALVNDSFKNLAEHAFQDDVNSPYLKQIKTNLSEIEQICKDASSAEAVTISSQRTRNPIEDKTNLLKIVYAMSRFDYPMIQSITKTQCSQTEAFNYLAKITGTKATTLKNMRDRFDPYVTQTRSKRKGWHQVDLLPEYQAIKDSYDTKDESTITQEIAEILEQLKKKS